MAVFLGRQSHDDVIKWKHFSRYWSFVQGNHRWPVNSPHKGQWRRALMFSLICAWINGWVNNREACDLRRHWAHYDVTVMMWNACPIHLFSHYSGASLPLSPCCVPGYFFRDYVSYSTFCIVDSAYPYHGGYSVNRGVRYDPHSMAVDQGAENRPVFVQQDGLSSQSSMESFQKSTCGP